MVSEQDVSSFKTQYCPDENPAVIEILRTELSDWVSEPVLDVGSGLGDIAREAFPNKRVLLLDRLDFSAEPKSPFHERRQGDFWDYVPAINESPGTILLSHVLQFLDDDPLRFNRRLHELGAPKIIAVLNRDVGTLDEIVQWADQHLERVNPERDIPALFSGFSRKGSWTFESHLTCPDFQTLSQQVGYLLDSKLSNKGKDQLSKFLADKLTLPSFSIQQHVVAYEVDRSGTH